MSIEQVWGSSWAPGAWADGAWGSSEVVEEPAPQPQPTDGGGGGTFPSRKRRSPTRSRPSSGRWVRVDDDDTRREREEREAQRRRAVAEEVQRSRARLDEIEQEQEIERKRSRKVVFGSAGSVDVSSRGALAVSDRHAVVFKGGRVRIGSHGVDVASHFVLEAFASAGLVETGSGSLTLTERNPVQTMMHENAGLLAEVAQMRREVAEITQMKRDLLRMRRNMEALEVLMMAA